MDIAVIAAAGRTGRQVVDQALGRGMGVRALSRTPAAVGMTHDRLEVIGGDVREPRAVFEALRGTGAVISTLGVNTARTPTDVYSQGAGNILTAMDALSIGRLLAVSGAPAGPRAEQPLFERRVAMPILDRFLGETYADMRRMEAMLAESRVEWTAVRPPRLVDRPGKGVYRISPRPVPGGRAITIADLARALLDLLDAPAFNGQAVYVAN